MREPELLFPGYSFLPMFTVTDDKIQWASTLRCTQKHNAKRTSYVRENGIANRKLLCNFQYNSVPCKSLF
jgi:hypothetical protein